METSEGWSERSNTRARQQKGEEGGTGTAHLGTTQTHRTVKDLRHRRVRDTKLKRKKERTARKRVCKN